MKIFLRLKPGRKRPRQLRHGEKWQSVGEEMKKFKDQDVSGWLMSEKHNGIFGEWTGSELLTKAGNKIHAPKWFTDQLPKVQLEGELQMGRGNFQKCLSVITKKSPVDEEWQGVHFMVFDSKEIDDVFEERLSFCSSVLQDCKVASVVKHVFCEGEDHMKSYRDSLVFNGAEGVVLRDPDAFYDGVDGYGVFKEKPYQDDEAEVCGYNKGSGIYADCIGSITCMWNGMKIKVGGLTEHLRNNPPSIGLKITFKFCDFTDLGKPKSPVFVAVRNYE